MMVRYIEEEDLKVLTEEGFVERYEKECRKGITYKAAYENVEAVYVSIVGKRRYQSPNAFRQMIYRRRKKTFSPKL